jgi:hypothetical protein
MNTHDLARHYDRLTARERLALLVAASARADAVERGRLMRSAPPAYFKAPHHYRLAEALFDAAGYHLLTVLDLATKYREWWGLWGWHCLRDETEKDRGGKGGRAAARAEGARLNALARYHAYLLVTHVDAWARFCADWAIDPEALLGARPGWDTVRRTEVLARGHAFSHEEAELFLVMDALEGQEGIPESISVPPVPTAEALAREWHDLVDDAAEDE